MQGGIHVGPIPQPVIRFLTLLLTSRDVFLDLQTRSALDLWTEVATHFFP